MGEKGRYPADRSRLSFAIVEGEVAFSGSIELENSRDLKSLLEPFPNVRAKAITAAEPQRVTCFLRMRGAYGEIAAKLTDVLEDRALPVGNVVPKLARGKSLA